MTTQTMMADTVNPANLGIDWSGQMAMRGSVLADPAAHWFDVEDGNAPPEEVAASCVERQLRGAWSVVYFNEEWSGPALDALRAAGAELRSSAVWPSAGVYLWAAAPGLAERELPPWCPVVPVAVQVTQGGGLDLSYVYGGFTPRVAGYLDGPRSAWPAESWSRFALVADPPPPPPPPPIYVPVPVPSPIGAVMFNKILARLPIGPSGEGWAVFDGGAHSDPGSASLEPAISWPAFLAVTPYGPDPVHDPNTATIAVDVQERGGFLFVRARGAAPGPDTAVAHITYVS